MKILSKFFRIAISCKYIFFRQVKIPKANTYALYAVQLYM